MEGILTWLFRLFCFSVRWHHGILVLFSYCGNMSHDTTSIKKGMLPLSLERAKYCVCGLVIFVILIMKCAPTRHFFVELVLVGGSVGTVVGSTYYKRCCRYVGDCRCLVEPFILLFPFYETEYTIPNAHATVPEAII